MEKEFSKPTSLDPNRAQGDYYLRKVISDTKSARQAADAALAQAFDVVKFAGLLQDVPSSWTHVADASAVKSTDSGYDVMYDTVNKRLMLLNIIDGKATYYTHWSDADKFGVGSGSFGSYRTFKPFEHKIYSNDKILYVYDGEQMIAFANLADASLLQDAFDAAAVKTFDDLWIAIGGTTSNNSYTDPEGNLIGGKKSAYSEAVKYFVNQVKNILSQDEVDKLKEDISNLQGGSGAVAIKFAGIKEPEIFPLQSTIVLATNWRYDVFFSLEHQTFYLEARWPDTFIIGQEPTRGEVVACFGSWPDCKPMPPFDSKLEMGYYGTVADGAIVPHENRIYVDKDGHLFVQNGNTLVSSILPVGDNSTIGDNVALKNIHMEVDPSTGILSVSNSKGVSSMTMGIYNTIGSSNLIQSNVTLSDRAALNAHVVSYAATGLLSIRHVIDGSAYSGMEHLNMGGYNVMGSNNKLASNINIGDKVTIENGAIFPANIGIVIVDGRVRVYGHEKLMAAGYVPYVFRKAKIRSMFNMTREGEPVNGDRDGDRLLQKKGWRSHGSYRAYRIIDSELYFSLDGKRFWSKPDESLGFSRDAVDLVQPDISWEKGACELRVPYGRKYINGGKASDAYYERGLRNLKIEYALAFGLPIDSAYRQVTPADMITPLMTFTVRFNNTGIYVDGEGFYSSAYLWYKKPKENRNVGWTFGK